MESVRRQRPTCHNKTTSGCYLYGTVSHGDGSRPELVAIHELELYSFAEPCEQRRPVSSKDGLYDELILVNQSQVCQGQGESHAAHPQPLAGLLLKSLNLSRQVASN